MRIIYLSFAIGLSMMYISLSPASIAGMGYTGEDMRAGNQLLSQLGNPGGRVDMPRNGLLPVILDLPFLALGAIDANREIGQDIVLATEPCVLTALILTFVLIWLHRVTGDLRYSLGIALAGAFCSMLWPYAYIGLETKQAFFLLLAAFLALEFQNPGSWGAVLTFSMSASFAAGSKSTGAFLLPAVGYLIWQFCSRLDRGALVKRLVSAVFPLLVFLLNSYARSRFWAAYGGSASFIKVWLVHDALSPFLNLAAFFGSANKGLWVFSPLCLLACYALPVAWRHHRNVAIFALLTLGGLAGGYSLLRNWADETWGPRYLLTTVAPLLIVLGVSWRRPMSMASRAVLALVAAAGLLTASLGVLVSYTILPVAAIQSHQNTLEGYQGDIALNHLLFNMRIFDLWIHPEHDASFTSERQWFFERPPSAPPPKVIDLHQFAGPQPFLLRHWRTPKTGPIGRLWFVYLTLLGAGLLLLSWTGRRAYLT